MRLEAEQKLLISDNKNGAFLIRQTEARHELSLSSKIAVFFRFIIAAFHLLCVFS